MKPRLPFNFRDVSACLLLLLLFGGPVAAADLFPVSPGTEVGVTAPEAGKPFLVYIPTDYTDARPFPIIFSYHGYGGAATTWPFKQITQGAGFIVVGMPYATDRYYRNHLPPTETGPEKAFWAEALVLISERLNVATDYIFMGGYSQGGYSTTVLGEQLLDRLAGWLVLGAGRRDVDMNPPPAKLIRGHPVFYGVGRLDDPHYPRAERAAKLYTEWGADVTFEAWEDETHALSPDWMRKTHMREWLRTYGPMKQVARGLERAEAAEMSGELGEAFVFYTQIAGILPDTEACRTAKAAAARLGAEAAARLEELKADTDPYAERVKALEAFRRRYAGSRFAETASELLKTLLNAKADALEARARAAEAEENYARALQLYELYLAHFRAAERYPMVAKHVKTLKKRTSTQ